MENFTYTDIFATKGIEYIVIIVFLVLLVPFWIIINRPAALYRKFSLHWISLNLSAIRHASGRFYHQNHTWSNLEKRGLAKIGVNDWLLKVLGPVQAQFLVKPGHAINKGQPVVRLQQGEKWIHLRSPLSGAITHINEKIINGPGLLLKHPYTRGWLITVKPNRWQSESGAVIKHDKVIHWFEAELLRLKDFIASAGSFNPLATAGIHLQEGGELKIYPLKETELITWQNFEEEFLTLND